MDSTADFVFCDWFNVVCYGKYDEEKKEVEKKEVSTSFWFIY
jgi:hypothetical protein